MLLSLLMTLAALPLAGLLPLSPLALLGLALAAAPLAPLVALFLAGFAANKVQGFALQKALGVLLLAPYLAALLPGRWELLAGLVPTYWPAALLWGLQAQADYTWALLPIGLAYQAALLAGLLRRFERVTHT
jgi:fluoroquinolone transport system permease protein